MAGIAINALLIERQVQVTASLNYPIHPHCLDAVIRAGGSLVALADCEERNLEVPVSSKTLKSPVDANQVLSFTSHFKPTEDNPDPGFTGFTMTKNAFRGPQGEILFLSHYYNDGGSGTFFSLVALSVEKHNGITYGKGLMREVVGSGDRCNDGYVEFSDATDQKIYWSHAATHFRLFNPLDTTDWRAVYRIQKLMPEAARELETPLTFLNWAVYGDLSNSANGCVGRILKSFDHKTREYELVGVMVNTSDFIASSTSTDAEACSIASVNEVSTEPSQYSGEFIMFSNEQWQSVLEHTSKRCSTDR